MFVRPNVEWGDPKSVQTNPVCPGRRQRRHSKFVGLEANEAHWTAARPSVAQVHPPCDCCGVRDDVR